MGKGDSKKLRGNMSSYAFFVQSCQEKHKKQHLDASVSFSEFSKKCSERWKIVSAKEKGKFEDMAKVDKAQYEREMKAYIPPKGETKKFKDHNAPKRPPLAFFLFCSEYCPKTKGDHPGLSTGDVAKKLREMWNHTAAEDKQPGAKRAAQLKERYEKDIAAHRARGEPDAVKRGGVKAEKSSKKKEEEEDKEDDDALASKIESLSPSYSQSPLKGFPGAPGGSKGSSTRAAFTSISKPSAPGLNLRVTFLCVTRILSHVVLILYSNYQIETEEQTPRYK